MSSFFFFFWVLLEAGRSYYLIYEIRAAKFFEPSRERRANRGQAVNFNAKKISRSKPNSSILQSQRLRAYRRGGPRGPGIVHMFRGYIFAPKWCLNRRNLTWEVRQPAQKLLYHICTCTTSHFSSILPQSIIDKKPLCISYVHIYVSYILTTHYSHGETFF